MTSEYFRGPGKNSKRKKLSCSDFCAIIAFPRGLGQCQKLLLAPLSLVCGSS